MNAFFSNWRRTVFLIFSLALLTRGAFILTQQERLLFSRFAAVFSNGRQVAIGRRIRRRFRPRARRIRCFLPPCIGCSVRAFSSYGLWKVSWERFWR